MTNPVWWNAQPQKDTQRGELINNMKTLLASAEAPNSPLADQTRTLLAAYDTYETTYTQDQAAGRSTTQLTATWHNNLYATVAAHPEITNVVTGLFLSLPSTQKTPTTVPGETAGSIGTYNAKILERGMTDLLGNTGTTGTTTTTPATTAPTTTTGAGSSGSFPASEMGGLSGPTDAFAKQILSQTPTEFFSEYQITTSNDEPLYEDPSNANQLNNNAVWLAWYANLGVTDRQDLQDAMVTLGSLTTAQATGGYNSTTIGAFQKALGDSSSVNSNVLDYLNNADSGIASLQEQIATAKTKEETEANAPITAAVSPKATLAASITSAFDQALGFTPANIQSQVNDFIDQIQGQEVSESAGGQERAQANAQIAQADDESSELNKLGTDGVDTVLQAYAAAVSGTKLPGAGTPQGPVVAGAPSNTGQYLTPGSKLPPNTTAGFNASGTEMVANTVPTSRTTTQQVPNTYGVGGALRTDLNPMTLLHPSGPQLVTPGQPSGGTHAVTTTTNTPTPGMATAPNIPAGAPGTTPVHGGMYALTPAQWAEAQTLSPTLKTYVSKTPAAATAAGASPGMQQTAAQALLLNNYDSTGSMSAAVTALANGGPVAKGRRLAYERVRDQRCQ